MIELEKLVHAALWNELEGGNSTSHTTDHLLLSAGQSAHCMFVCVGIRAVVLYSSAHRRSCFLLENFKVFISTDENKFSRL